MSNPFYTDIIRTIESTITDAGFTMVMQQIGACDDEVKCGAVMEREKRLRGIIFLGGRFDYTPADLALLDLQTHPVFNLDEQLAMFDASKGQSKAQYAQSEMARFFAEIGSINKDELKRVEDGSYATDKFLKLIKKPIPSYK